MGTLSLDDYVFLDTYASSEFAKIIMARVISRWDKETSEEEAEALASYFENCGIKLEYLMYPHNFADNYAMGSRYEDGKEGYENYENCFLTWEENGKQFFHA